MNTPILFLMFNRPDTAQKVFDEIKKIKPKYLFVAADGPREMNEQDEMLCRESRSIIDQIDWPCEVKTLFREKNLGCKIAVSSAIDWFFENVEAGIILEDDCVPHQSFFRFAGEMLEKYKDEEKIMMITGLNPISTYQSPYRYYFSRYFSIWGWATWRCAWQKYDITMHEWPRIKATGLDRYYADPYARKYMERSFDAVYSGKLNTWDTQWFFTCLINNGLSIVPSRNVISNIGIYGAHADGTGSNQNLPTFDLYERSLMHPLSVEENANYDSLFFIHNFHPKEGHAVIMIKKLYRRICVWFFGYGVFENVNKTAYKKNCLLLYIVGPFRDRAAHYGHQNYWQVRELARIVGEFGYNVDVIQFNDRRTKLMKKYDLVIDLHPGMNSVYADHLNTGAKRVAYITGSNPSFSNQAERERLDDIYRRRGIRLKPRRYAQPFDPKLLSSFDAMFFIGNTYNLKTYAVYTPEKVFFIKNTGYDFLAEHDHSKRSPKTFLFLASGGQVHKGLDLLLEVFSKNTDLDLYVCSYFTSEKDFTDLYRKELFETKNIHPIGFVDVTSPTFAEIIKRCTYLIAPSCSEGQSGSVLTGMSAGLIPIVSRECGFDEHEVHLLPDCRLETIEKTIREYAEKPIAWREQEAERILSIIHDQYTNEHFSESVRAALLSL